MSNAAKPKSVIDDKLGTLPAWDLSDLYPGTDSPELKQDLERCETAAKDFHKRYEGGLGDLDGAALAGAIDAYQALQETLGRVMSYAQLVYSGNMSDPAVTQFYQAMQERTTAISTAMLFFTLELNGLEDDLLQSKLSSPELAHYGPWLRDLRSYRPHQLDEEIERLLHEKSVSGRAAWTRLFDETMAALRFPFAGGELGNAEILNKLGDRSPEVRKEAAKSLGKVLGENQRTFALITNTLAKDKQTEDSWRKFARPISSRNLANVVEDEVVDALVTSVSDAYPSMSHRYYKLKAKWFGVEQLPYWDRNAPLPDDNDKIISWDDARSTVLDAYASFSPKLAEVGSRFFEKPWIDAPVRPGKAPGAFAHPTVPSAHPYLLLNYQGRTRDVMTLAHELGHGCHQVFAAPQGHLMADTPLTLAETASVFGEMLTFQSLLRAESDPTRRKVMLASKVEDMLNTVVRQIAMHQFETRVHDERRSGELLPERLGEIWLETQRESLGPALKFDADYKHYWAYIPHFIHVPFYVYAYAFGDCLVNSLYAVYEQASEGFAEKYLEMLSAGGTKRHKELLAPFGLDASDPDFWGQGLSLIGRFIDELEQID
ncbi:M3 family oligoendopeptidase [Denitrobaculum tricleocarpae]|uniref:M3 family oligoendopeptidase n=1 Tax=Denitrobaculum tricleocarpae TaxID=2591009 RepID=A0A545TWU6_9PROT|nr:M3 family oligoendopeptidase [Denitrobaculum tricleocarpae]TQV81690.1 M3 family oligoendopeptidase [Denitrobaculum tricleocarpae]